MSITYEGWQSLVKWQAAKPQHRAVEFKINTNVLGNSPAKAWVYDYSILSGQFVTHANEINIYATQTKIDSLRETIRFKQEQLAKLEGEAADDGTHNGDTDNG